MSTSERLREIERLNLRPNNQIALKILPWDWQGESSLHVLALALWGIQEGGINVELPGPGATMDQVEATVIAMRDWNPINAMAFVEGDRGDEQTLVLDADESPETNAMWVLESIRAKIDELAP
jgi:hypothetical protein